MGKAFYIVGGILTAAAIALTVAAFVCPIGETPAAAEGDGEGSDE